MNNKEIYKKTLGFSIRRMLWDVLAFIALIAIAVIGFIIADKTSGNGLIGLALGTLVGGITVYLILHYFGYANKAGQIAMMQKGITENKLPDDVIAEGKKEVKSRFATVVAYYAVTKAIKGIFGQIGSLVTSVGQSVGGDTGGTIGSIISSAIQTIINYLSDCCLGWVFYRKDESSAKATCEGAAIFFKHGKTLAKNLGRIFGIGILSFIVIAGIFGGISYLISLNFHDAFAAFCAEIAETSAEAPEWMTNPNVIMIILSVVIGGIFWSMIHSVFIRPFVLVGVLRNFINSGKDDIPSEASFKELDSKSTKFKKLHSEL